MKAFRIKVREIVNDVIDNRLPLENNTEINYAHPFWTIVMGIEHEKIHLETTSCLIRQLPLKCLKSTELEASLFISREHSTSRTYEDALKIFNTWVEVPTTEVKIGRVHTGFQDRNEHAVPYYGWDNEFGTHSAKVEGFKVSDKLISNAQFYEFVSDHGY
jgi:formylglycine-generating enzyme required for sulfatase activity